MALEAWSTTRTKKIGPAGRFGARGGATVRNRWGKIHRALKQKYQCTRCQVGFLRRLSVGVWSCRKCGYTFAGGAYVPMTKIEH